MKPPRFKLRFSLRHLLAAIAVIALVSTFAAHTRRGWVTEQISLDRIGKATSIPVGRTPQDLIDLVPPSERWTCDSPQIGAHIVYDSLLPNFVGVVERRFGISRFGRVTEIVIYRVHDPALVAELYAFPHLRSARFVFAAPSSPSQMLKNAEYLGAIKLFAANRPEIAVEWPDTPIKSLYDHSVPTTTPAGADPFGESPF